MRRCQDPRRVNENAPAPVAHVAEARHVQLDGNLKKELQKNITINFIGIDIISLLNMVHANRFREGQLAKL